jgi:Transcriptional regulator
VSARAESSAGPFALDFGGATPHALSRLPTGRHGLPREFIEFNQRNRLLAAAVDQIAERGYLAATVADITKVAAVSRRTFYLHFANREACLLAAYDVILEWLELEGARAAQPDRDWARNLSAAVGKVLALLAADPRIARVCATEILFAGEVGWARHRTLVDRLAVRLALGRSEPTAGVGLPANLEGILIGGAISLIARYVDAGDGDRLTELGPELTEFLLLPYLGTG